MSSECNSTIERARSSIMVVSFDRASLGQTGEGHFSPIGGYDAKGDRVLILDVARFKYPPYWVSVESLYEAMKPKDSATGRSRGYFVMKRTDFDGFGVERKLEAADLPSFDEIEGRGCPLGEIAEKYKNPNFAGSELQR